MRKLLRALVSSLVLPWPTAAAAVVCASESHGTWFGAPPASGTVRWSCGSPPTEAEFEIRHAIVVPRNLGSAEARLRGGIRVQAGGALSLAPGATIFSAAPVLYESGSSGVLRGAAVALEAPDIISFPSPSEILLGFPSCEGAGPCPLPGGLALCDATSTCGPLSVHAATATESATLLYVDWERRDAPGDRFVGREGRALEHAGVNDPGLFLEVSDVDPVARTVTLRLPDVGEIGALRWFTVREALAGTRLRNLVGGSAFTVHSAGQRKNNENKRRFEIRIDPSDTPFDEDHEFEAFLACRRDGRWCARIVKSLVDHHLDTGETLVVWKDPTGHLSPGDELDVYYARPEPGDPLVFLNPVKFDLTGGGRLEVAGGANVATTESPASGWWVTGATGNANDSISAGVSFENETLGIVLDLALVEHGEGAPLPQGRTSPDALGFRSRTTGLGIHGLRLSRTTVRFPQVDQTEWTDGSSFLATPNAIVPQEGPGDGGTAVWSGGGLRKIRITGYNYGLNGARGGLLRDCADGLWLQDVLMLHGRSAVPRARETQGNDGLETYALGAGCDVDRVAVASSRWSAALVIRSAREAPNHWTSIVVFGADGRVSDAWPAMPDQLRHPPKDAIFAQPASGSGFDPFAAYGYARLSNWMTDGGVSPIDDSYGARVDYYVAETASPPAVGTCGTSVGLHAVGGATASSADACLGSARADTGACAASSAPRIVDLVLEDLQAQVNLTRASGFPSLVMGGVASTPPASFTFDGVEVELRSADTYLALFDAFRFPPGWILPSLVLRDVRLEADSESTSLVWRDPAGASGLALVSHENVAVEDETGLSPRCQVNGAVVECRGCTICNPDTDAIFGGDDDAPWSDEPDDEGGEGPRPVRWAGPVVYDWPFAFASVDPVPGRRRTAPRAEFVPEILRRRMGPDADGDGVPDAIDACVLSVDPEQRDVDGDGFGNACDADFDGDGLVAFPDLAILRAGFYGDDPLLDLDGDGLVAFTDLAILKSLFLEPPGPSSIALPD